MGSPHAYGRPRGICGGAPAADQARSLLHIFFQIGAVVFNDVHEAAIRIGETAAVFGLGKPGQIVGQLAKKSGATVIGVELCALRLRVASELGAVEVASDARQTAVEEKIKAVTGKTVAPKSVLKHLAPIRRFMKRSGVRRVAPRRLFWVPSRELPRDFSVVRSSITIVSTGSLYKSSVSVTNLPNAGIKRTRCRPPSNCRQTTY